MLKNVWNPNENNKRYACFNRKTFLNIMIKEVKLKYTCLNYYFTNRVNTFPARWCLIFTGMFLQGLNRYDNILFRIKKKPDYKSDVLY